MSTHAWYRVVTQETFVEWRRIITLLVFSEADQGFWSFTEVHAQLYTLPCRKTWRSQDLEYSLAGKPSHIAPRILGRISWQSLLWEVLCSGLTFMREVSRIVPRLLKKGKKKAKQTVVAAWHMQAGYTRSSPFLPGPRYPAIPVVVSLPLPLISTALDIHSISWAPVYRAAAVESKK